MATDGAKKFSVTLSKVVRDINDLRKDSHGLKEYDELCNEQNALKRELLEKKQELERKDQEMADLCRDKDSQLALMREDVQRLKMEDEVITRKYQTQFKHWEADTKRHSTEIDRISQLRHDLQYWRQKAEKADTAKAQLRHQCDERSKWIEDYRKNMEGLQRELKMKELMIENMSAEQEDHQNLLTKANKDIGILPIDRAQVSDEFKDLASKLQELVQASFYRNSLHPEANIDIFDSPLSRIPQVASNTEPALRMRCALAEAIIAEQLSTYIFQDFYVPSSGVADLRELTKVLLWLDERSPLRASIARCQIAMAFDDPRDKEAIIGRITKNVCHSLTPWIHDSKVQESFSRDLMTLFRSAMNLWQQLQRTSEHAIAIVDVAVNTWNALEDAREEYDKVAIEEHHEYHGAASESTTPTAALFPQIWIGEDLLFHGYALYPNQSAVIAASLENKKGSLSGNSIRRRRKSGNRTWPAPDHSASESRVSNTSRHRAQGHSLRSLSDHSNSGVVTSQSHQK